MTKTSQDSDLYPGESRVLNFVLTDANDEPYVAPSNFTIEYKLSETSHDEPLLRLDLTDGVILEDATAEVALTRLQTAGLLPGRIYFHQITLLDKDTNDSVVMATGHLMVRYGLPLPSVTENASAGLQAGGALAVDATKTP